MPQPAVRDMDTGLDKVVALLGGHALFDRPFSTPLDAHSVIQSGFPNQALLYFIDSMPALGQSDVLDKVVGMSLRTLQRRKKDGAHERLSREQSGRLYKAAEIVAKAIDVFGSTEAAQDFLERPAMALDGERPIDLLSTPAGAEIVERHLARLDLGVYA